MINERLIYKVQEGMVITPSTRKNCTGMTAIRPITQKFLIFSNFQIFSNFKNSAKCHFCGNVLNKHKALEFGAGTTFIRRSTQNAGFF